MTPERFPCFSQPVPAHTHPAPQSHRTKAWLTAFQVPKLHGEPPADGVPAWGSSEHALVRSRAALRALAPGLPPYLACATTEQHRVFLFRDRAAATHRHGELPRTLPGSPNDDFRRVGLLRPEEDGGPEAAPEVPHVLGDCALPVHSSHSSFSPLLLPPLPFLLALSRFPLFSFQRTFLPPQTPSRLCSFFKSVSRHRLASLGSSGWPFTTFAFIFKNDYFSIK